MPVAGGTTRRLLKRLSAPAQELVALAVAGELDIGVALQGQLGAEEIDLDRVVDDQIDQDQRVDPLGVAAEQLDGIAHGGQIDDARDAGEVLHDDAGGHEGQIARVGVGGLPAGQTLDVIFGDEIAIDVAQNGFEQNLDGEGQARQAGGQAQLGQAGQTVVLVLGVELSAGAEGVEGFGGHKAGSLVKGFSGCLTMIIAAWQGYINGEGTKFGIGKGEDGVNGTREGAGGRDSAVGECWF